MQLFKINSAGFFNWNSPIIKHILIYLHTAILIAMDPLTTSPQDKVALKQITVYALIYFVILT